MAADNNDKPGVIAAPPLVYLGFLVLGLALDELWPAAIGLRASHTATTWQQR